MNIYISSGLISLAVSILAIFVILGRKLEQLDHLRENYKELRDEVKKMQEIRDIVIELRTSFKYLPTPQKARYAQQHSPIQLTDEGNDVRKQIKADELINKYADTLYSFVNSSKMSNAYDIQIEAFNIIADKFYGLLSQGEMIDIKNTAYQLGKTLEDFLIIFQILFRDYILKKHGMVAADVDKHNPENTKH